MSEEEPQGPGFDEAKVHKQMADMLRAGVPHAEVEAWFTKHYGSDATPAAPAAAAPAEPDAGPSLAHRGGAVDFARAGLSGLTFGTSAKAVAGLKAAFDTDHVGGGFSDRYEKYKASERSAEKEYQATDPKKAIAATLLGGLIPAVLTGGAGEIGEVGTLARAGKAAWQGAKLGAGAGFINADDNRLRSAVGTGLLGGVLGGATTLGGAAIGGAASKLGAGDAASNILEKIAAASKGRTNVGAKAAQAVERLLPQSLRGGEGLTPWLSEASGALGAKGRGAEELAQRVALDEAKGTSTIGTQASGLATRNIDRLGYKGSNVESLAKDIVRSPGKAKGVLRGALEEDAAAVRPTTASELERLTGQQAGQGSRPLAAQVDKSDAALKSIFDEARDLTRGQEVKSAAFDDITKNTPAGRRAMSEAMAERANRPDNPLPVIQDLHIKPAPPPLDQQFGPDQWEALVKRDLAKGGPLGKQYAVETERQVPDAELMHSVKRKLAEAAGMSKDEQQRSEANAAMQQWSRVREEIKNTPFGEADAKATQVYKDLDAARAGRKIFGTREQGRGRTAKGDIAKSLDAVVDKNSPRETFQPFAGRAAADKLANAPKKTSLLNFMAGNQEKTAQLRTAFPDQAGHEDFLSLLKRGDEIGDRNTNVLKGSPTHELGVEDRRRNGPSAISQLMHPIKTAKSIGTSLSNAGKDQRNQEIAKILADHDAGLISKAKADALMRATMFKFLGSVGGVTGAQLGDRTTGTLQAR